MIGSIIDGKYRITRQLGAGAMGAVYEAEHTATGRRVAVKVITSGLANNTDLIGRFKQEAMAAGRVETKHITQVLDAGVDRDSGLPFMVMEFLTGQDLQHLIKKLGTLAPELALRITAQACLGLQKAHESGVVHRDIKPANLFLAESDGEIVVKVLDFGIAKVHMEQAHDTESAHLTRTGSLLGSPLYMSPEQARGLKGIDARADIWSLGATLYHCLAGRSPYHHITALGELIFVICSEPPPSVQQFAPWVPPEVAAIVHGCLRQDPAERFQSAKDMLAAIKQLLPYGWAIQPEMLAPMDDASRSVKVATYALPAMAPQAGTALGGPAGVSGSQPGLPAETASHPGYGSNPNIGSQPGYGSNPNATSQSGNAVLLQSQAAPQRSSPVMPLVLGGLVVAAMGIGATTFLLTRQSTPPPQPAATATQAAVAPAAVATVDPKPSPTPPPVAPPPEEDKSNRRVKVAIVPPDAQVEIEGKPTTISKGLIELEGKLGDVFKVTVRKGGIKKEEEVIVTKDGPSLPMISLFVTTTAKSSSSSGPNLPKGSTDKFE